MTCSEKNMADRRTMFECEECKEWFADMEVFIRHPCVVKASGNLHILFALGYF